MALFKMLHIAVFPKTRTDPDPSLWAQREDGSLWWSHTPTRGGWHFSPGPQDEIPAENDQPADTLTFRSRKF